MPQAIEGQLSFRDELTSLPGFTEAPEDKQIEFIDKHYLPGKLDGYSDQPEAKRKDFIKQIVLPQLNTSPVQAMPKPLGQTLPTAGPISSGGQLPAQPGPQPLQNMSQEEILRQGLQQSISKFAQNPIRGLSDDLQTLNNIGGSVTDPALHTMTFGVVNPADTQKFLPKSTDPNSVLYQSQQIHDNPALNAVGTLAGFGNPIGGLENVAGSGIAQLGRQVLPAAAKGVRGSRFLSGILTNLQGSGLAARMAREAAAFGGYEALKHEDGVNDFDMGARLQRGLQGAATGAAFPLAGRLISGAAKATKGIFNPEAAAQIKLGPSLGENYYKAASGARLYDFKQSVAHYPKEVQNALIEEFKLRERLKVKNYSPEMTEKIIQAHRDMQAGRLASSPSGFTPEEETFLKANAHYPKEVRKALWLKYKAEQKAAHQQHLSSELLKSYTQAFKEAEAAAGQPISESGAIRTGTKKVYNDLTQLHDDLNSGVVKAPEQVKTLVGSITKAFEDGSITHGQVTNTKTLIKGVRERYTVKPEGTPANEGKIKQPEGQQPAKGQEEASQIEPTPAESPNQKETVSPFAEIPENMKHIPQIVGYVSKKIADSKGLVDAAVTAGKRTLNKIATRHADDIKALGLKDAKEYVEYIFKNANKAYTNGTDEIILVVEKEGGHISPLVLHKEKGVKRYVLQTSYSPENLNNKVKNLELLWDRSESIEQLEQLPSLQGHVQNEDSIHATSTNEQSNSESNNTTPEEEIKPQGQILHASIEKKVQDILKRVGMTFQEAVDTIHQLKNFPKLEDNPEYQAIVQELEAHGKTKRDDKASELRLKREEVAEKHKQQKSELQAKANTIREADENLKQLLDAGVDFSKETAPQSPVAEDNQLLYGEIENDLPADKKPLAKKLEESLVNKTKVKAEYAGEIEGRSNEASHVTKGGNVKVTGTEFTVTSFGKVEKTLTKDGREAEDVVRERRAADPNRQEAAKLREELKATTDKEKKKVLQGQIDVLNKKIGKATIEDEVNAMVDKGEAKREKFIIVNGHNQRGHEVMYYLTKSPEGSEILRIAKSNAGPGFVGMTPNRVHGPTEFKLADVLNRGPRSEEGFIKTSEAIAAAEQIKNLYEKETFNSLPKIVQDILKSAQKNGRLDKNMLDKVLSQIQKDAKQKEMLCKILGLNQ